MPELPEVETTIKGLNSKVLERTFVDVWSDWHKTVKRPKNFEVFKRELRDKKIKKIWRRAKNIIFDLSDGYSLLVHQKMTGHLLVGNWKLDNGKWKPVKKGPLDEKINLFIHVLFFLDDRQMIALSDLRKFAKIELWKTEDLLRSKEFKDLGPEPLEKGFTFKKFKECLKIPSSSPDPLGHYGAGKKGKIKQVLMDPNVIAGIGNIYSNEALWWAKINPQKGALKLTEKELKSLYRSIKKVLVAGIKLGGESFSDYRNVEGRKGNFDDERKVYQREGQKCFRCKTPIQRLKFGGRSAFFCPHCQNPY